MLRLVLPAICSLFFLHLIRAQTPCGYDFLLKQCREDTVSAKLHEDIEDQVFHFFQKKDNWPSLAENGNIVLTIPVVVHILHDGGPENISDAQATAAIQYLNDAFANIGHFFQGSGAASNIRFCLATRDPQGNATTGILRAQTPLTDLNLEQDGLAKSLSRWPTQDYLNIWVVREICWTSLGCGVGAYASPPAFHGGGNDGIVIENRYFGTTPSNTSPLAHEAGHYLGLYHTFTGGCDNNDCLIDGDRICDTPPDQSTAAIPCDQTVNTCNTDAQSGLTSDLPDATDNFLDYGDINCQHNFTAGQAARMEFILENNRKSLLISKGCALPCPAPVTANFTPGDTIVDLGSAITFLGQIANAGKVEWFLNGQPVSAASNWNYTFSQQGLFTIALNAQGTNTALCSPQQVQHTVQVVCPVLADFSIEPKTPVLNEPVILTNLSKNYTTVEWFVNGISQGSNLSGYTFSGVGSNSIRLVVGNGLCAREKTLAFTLSEACESKVFQKTMDTPAEPERAKATFRLSDGNLLLGGEGTIVGSGQDIIFIKTNEIGTPIWTKRFGDASNQSVEDLAPTDDGGFVMVGSQVMSISISKAIIARFSSAGEVLWQRMVVSSQSSHLRHVIRSGDDYIAVGWYIRATDQAKSGFILKFNAQGAVVWSKTYAFLPNRYMEFTDVDQASPADSLYISGIIQESNSTNTDGLMVSLDPSGQNSYARRVHDQFNVGQNKLLGVGRTSTGIRYVGALGSGVFTNEQGWEVLPDVVVVAPDPTLNTQTSSFKLLLSGETLRISGILKSSSGLHCTIFNTDAAGKEGGLLKNGGLVHYSFGANNNMEDIEMATDQHILTASTIETGGTTTMFLSKANNSGFAGQCKVPQLESFTGDGGFATATSVPLEQNGAPDLAEMALPVFDFSVKATSPCADSVFCAEDACKAGWVKSFGLSQPANSPEAIRCMVNAPDGTLFAVGYRSDSLAFLNISAEGDIHDIRTLRIPSTRAPRPNSLVMDSDGNWIVAGDLATATGLTNAFVLKYNPAQNTVIWLKQLVGGNSRVQTVREMKAGGNYLLNMAYSASTGGGGINNPMALVEINRNDGAIATGGFQRTTPPDVRGELLQIKQYNNEWWATGAVDDILMLFRFSQAGQELSRIRYYFIGMTPNVKASDFTIYQDTITMLIHRDSGNFVLLQTTLEGTILRAVSYQNRTAYSNGSLESSTKAAQIERMPDGGFILLMDIKELLLDRIHIVRLNPDQSVRWGQRMNARFLLSTAQQLTLRDKSLYIGFGTQEGNNSDFAIAKINVETGTILADNCDLIAPFNLASQPDFQLAKAELPAVFTQPYAPAFQNKTGAFQETITGSETYLCASPCTEICDNGANDDYDGRPDCFDTDCPCGNACDGEGANIWYFGKNAGLRFDTDPPTVLSDGKTNSRGPSSTQSDPKGRLLFYADSAEVRDRFHQPVSKLAAPKRPLIMPVGGTSERFDLFTTNEQNVFYTSFEMPRRNFSGDAGKVKNNIVGNVPGNKFTAYTCELGGWLVIKTAEGNKWLYNRLQTLAIPNPNPFFQVNAGTDNTNGINSAGQLKFSRDGMYLANTLPGTGGFDLLNFNQVSGEMTDFATVLLPELKDAFGLEFSPDDRYLYVSTYGSPSRIWQFDLEAGNDAASIANSQVLIAQSAISKTFGYLQLARNGKIYAAMNPNDAGSNALSVIHQPNQAGTKCQFLERGQPLGAGRGYYGLPQFVQGTLGQKPKLRIIGPDSICGAPAMVPFRLRGFSCDDNIQIQSSTQSATVTYNGGSTAVLNVQKAIPVRLILRSFSTCAGGADTFIIKVIDRPLLKLDLGPDITLCATGVTTLRATPGFVRFQWNDGTADSTLTTFAPGQYTLEVWDICGNSQKDTVEIKVEQNTRPNLGPDRQTCRTTGITLTRDARFARWEWSPKQYLDCDTCRIVQIKPGKAVEYVVVAQTAAGCLGADTLRIALDTVFARLDTFVCPNERLPFLNASLPPDTTAIFSLISASGCDSLLRVSTFALDTALRALTLRACPGDSIRYNGQFIPAGQTRPVVLSGQNGCDSTVVVKVTPFPAISLSLPRDTSLKVGDTLTLRSRANGGTGNLTLQWSPPENLSCVNCGATVFTALDTGIIRYQITAKDANGCASVGSVAIAVNDSCLVYWPNAFTPDGDGVNDRFYLLAFPCVYRIVSLNIFSRWGENVFSRTDFAPNDANLGWDGRNTQGEPFPTEVLFWTAEVQYYDGRKEGFKGQLTVLR